MIIATKSKRCLVVLALYLPSNFNHAFRLAGVPNCAVEFLVKVQAIFKYLEMTVLDSLKKMTMLDLVHFMNLIWYHVCIDATASSSKSTLSPAYFAAPPGTC